MREAGAGIRGTGLGLRAQHFEHILEHRPPVRWFEVLVDNYFAPGGLIHHRLGKIAENYPLVFHGVGLNLASPDPPDPGYLSRLKELSHRYQPRMVSDHLSWCALGNRRHHDLLPPVMTRVQVRRIAENIARVQDVLDRRILIENPTVYVRWKESEMGDGEFLSEVAEAADCGILLDVNNAYVNSRNHGSDPTAIFDALEPGKIGYLHVAGFEGGGGGLVDTHGSPVHPEVAELCRHALARLGKIPLCLERDANIPAFPELFNELNQLQALVEKTGAGNRRHREAG